MEEILHQLIGSLSHYLQGFIHHRWCRISSINSIIGEILPYWGDIFGEILFCYHFGTIPTKGISFLG